ncbi:hypothetical protein PHLCEN_2v6120 [Hermanssonia centrifuga]|uniref:Uncharacterized protein n=1 Tax=Hermanssonia centrifuga TaxID=98765 RepID=A0A2R6P0Z6_9APHY|nr:hypothetical protein PHLCEN_2v6120 [Hermanssonia centrifuga]
MFEWKRKYKEVRYREIHRKNGWMMGAQITGYEATPPHTSPATMVSTWRLVLLRQRNHAPPVKPKKYQNYTGKPTSVGEKSAYAMTGPVLKQTMSEETIHTCITHSCDTSHKGYGIVRELKPAPETC